MAPSESQSPRKVVPMGKPPTARKTLCVHEGDIIRPCGSCSGGMRHVRECDVKGETTWNDCDKCEFRVPDDSLIDPPPGGGGKRLLITLDTDDSPHYAAARPSHARYAEKIGATHLTLRGRAGWGHVVYEKWRYRKYVAAYDRTLILDSDTWVAPHAPDIFDTVPESHIGMSRVDEYLVPHFDWRGELRRLCESQGVDVPADATEAYYNCGVWVGSRCHADYWQHPPKPGRLPLHWCDEEQWGRVQCARLGYPIYDYGRRWNHQWYLDKVFTTAAVERPYIYHLAGMMHEGKSEWRVPLINLLESTRAAS